MTNILIVDDEKEIADLVEVYLKNENYTVYKYYSAKEVLDNIDNLDVFLKTAIEKLVILNPFHLMNKGYSIVYKDDIIISSITKIYKGDNIKIKMSDGNIDAIIK